MVTQKELHYDGSITIDRALMEAAKILPYERVQVLNVNNGERFETYALAATEKNAVVCLNGPAARLGEIGDTVTIISYALVEEEACQGWEPTIVEVDGKNRVVKTTG